jgi:branched-subunit amino acid transport protein AzlD
VWLLRVVWFFRRFPYMASLCSHVRYHHQVAEAEVKVQTFANYQEVNWSCIYSDDFHLNAKDKLIITVCSITTVICRCLQFIQWKEEMEKNTQSRFVQHESARTLASSRTLYFYCSRSGQAYKRPKALEERQRAVKSQGKVFNRFNSSNSVGRWHIREKWN